MLISNCCNLITNKIDVSQLTTSNYISTENLLPNFGGITIATNLPKDKVTKFEKENILMSNIRPYFKKFYYSSISGGCSSDVLVLNVNKSIAIPKYIYYLLCSDKFVNMYVANCKGTKMPRGNKEVLLNYQFELPSYEVQQHIVDTIGSIDDLIENNNTIIIKLENIILNLYRKKSIEWKKQVKIGDLFKCILGGTPSTKKNEYWDGDIAWVNSGEVNKLRIVSPSRYITKDGLENSATKLLPKKTTVIAITGATLGQVSLLEIDSCTNQSVIGILENNTLKHDFIYPMMINAIKKLVLNKTGGAQQHINKNDVETFEIFVPSEIEYFEYSQIVQPIFEYQSKLILQNKELLLLKNKYLQKFFG